MGKKDLWQSDYFDKNERFADIFNGALFGGKAVILSHELTEADGEIVSITDTKTEMKVIRDKVKKWHGGYLSILSLENQSYVDYRMVFRVMKEEALGYEKQWKEKKHKYQLSDEKLYSDEFLSGIKKKDKFVPIITLILYLGNDKAWDGAECLHEMLDMEDYLKAFVPDYRINVFDYHKYSDFSNFGQENKLLFELLSASDDKTKMADTLARNKTLCNKMDKDSISAILGIAGIHVNLEDIKQSENGKETYSMCKAFDEHKQEGYREGQRDGYNSGKVEGFNSCKISVIENMLRQNLADTLIMTIAECTQDVIDEVRKRLACSTN